MSRQTGSLILDSNIELQSASPLDARSVVSTKAELYAAGNFDYAYKGMLVVVQETSTLYILTNKPATVEANWSEISGASGDLDNYYTKPEVDALLSKLYKPAGVVAFDGLPTLSADVLGNVYSLNEDFTTTADFVEGAGKTYPTGSNVVVVDIGTEEIPDYRFDVLPGFIDLSALQTKLQVTALPEASEDEEGNIYQYVGATTGSLTNGYFYQCVEVAGTDPTEYEWVQKNVQDTSDLGVLSDALTSTVEVGGIAQGTTFAQGTQFETLWRRLLAPTLYPEFTAPSFTISTVTPLLQEAGSSMAAVINTSFDRGSIVPAYGTDGYRSGDGHPLYSSDLIIGAGTLDTTGGVYTFQVTISATNNRFQGRAHYEAGEQPKDSDGNDYDAPLPAGTADSNVIEFEFVDALWANTASIATIAKLPLVSRSEGVKEFTFPAVPENPVTFEVDTPEVFDVPASWNVTAVELYNKLSGTWGSCAGEFSITQVTHPNAAGTDVNYNRYTCNLGYAMGSRRIRIKF